MSDKGTDGLLVRPSDEFFKARQTRRRELLAVLGLPALAFILVTLFD